MERTLVICKPDAVERGLVGEIIGRLERKGLKLVACELRRIDEETAKAHYAEHAEKPFFGESGGFHNPLTFGCDRGRWSKGCVVDSEDPDGADEPRRGATGTIRGDYGTLLTENLVHGSDSEESAGREIGIFFPGLAAD